MNDPNGYPNSGQPPRRPPPPPRGAPLRPAPQPRGAPPRGPSPSEAQARPTPPPQPRVDPTDPFEAFRQQRAPAPRPAPSPTQAQASPPPPANYAAAPGPTSHSAPAPTSYAPPASSSAPAPAPQTQRFAPAGSGDPSDPFEAFRRQREAQSQQASAPPPIAGGAETEVGGVAWIEGIGPAGEDVDPNKPRGFTRGRFITPKVDPNALDRPGHYERTRLVDDDNPLPEVNPGKKPPRFTKF